MKACALQEQCRRLATGQKRSRLSSTSLVHANRPAGCHAGRPSSRLLLSALPRGPAAVTIPTPIAAHANLANRECGRLCHNGSLSWGAAERAAAAPDSIPAHRGAQSKQQSIRGAVFTALSSDLRFSKPSPSPLSRFLYLSSAAEAPGKPSRRRVLSPIAAAGRSTAAACCHSQPCPLNAMRRSMRSWTSARPCRTSTTIWHTSLPRARGYPWRQAAASMPSAGYLPGPVLVAALPCIRVTLVLIGCL